MAVLALPPLDGSLTEPVIFFSATISQRKVEPCGDVYELYLCRRLGLIEDSESEDEDANQQAEEGDEGVDKNKMNEKRKKANKSETLKKMLFKNHYDALGLESLYFEASIDDIRKAYKKKVLTHHPDKFEEEGGYDEIAKQQWLSVTSFLCLDSRSL
jgi:DnaJ family protein C protein 2